MLLDRLPNPESTPSIIQISLLVFMTLATGSLRADDGAASIAAGGVVIMAREPRLVMSKEVLEISLSKVIVDYDFRNDSAQSITTEVAFPIPDYDLSMESASPNQQGFSDFRLFVNGARARYRVQSRAYVKSRDYTSMLAAMHVDVASFGHASSNGNSPDLQRLTPTQAKKLEQAGLVNPHGNAPLWTVRKKYYWRQTFPAGKIVHVRHEYEPIPGGTNSIRYGMSSHPDPDSAAELKSFCISGPLRDALQRVANSEKESASYSYVDFILTTANTWKTPIEDFTLVVDRPKQERGKIDYVSFCWDGPVRKIDADHFSAHVVDFVPTKELRIGFFHVEGGTY